MRAASRTYAQRCSWDAVFDQVLAAYPQPAAANAFRTPLRGSGILT